MNLGYEVRRVFSCDYLRIYFNELLSKHLVGENVKLFYK